MGFRDSDTIIEPIDDGGAFDSGEGSTSSTSESAANALQAANSAAAALVSENNAAADVVLTNADVVLTHADVVLTNADLALTNADVVLTNADVVLAEADKVQTGLDRAAVAADLVLTNQDTIDTAANLVLTNADVVLTNADVVLTHADVVLAEADKVQTGLDRIATNADVVLTHADVVLTNADVVLAEADKVQTGLDRIATAADVVSTNADVVSTNADVVLAEADKVQTGLDRVATAADVVLTNADVVLTNADVVSAGNSVTAAALSATASATAKTAAETAKTAAETAETNAETAETNAETAETNAAGSATASSNSATSAATSASTATTKASEASTSETNALASKNAAAISETNASNSATASANSASSAATSETNAATSASTASSQASTATTKASEASASATSAATSASTATTKASEASASATSAATSASNSASSATAAQTAETNAETAETNAAASATTATTKAGESLTSANSSASSATTAEAAKDAALAALDSFDDRYLGAKSSDPTVDNDGNALISGALYYNTTDDAMKVYTGSAWVAAYASLAGTLLVANNLNDLDNAVSARSNLGLVIGTNVQAFSAILAATTASYTTALNTKLSGIETGATADQTGAEIKTAYQAEANAFTDSLYTKLDNIEASADVTDTANVVSSLTAGSNITIAADGTISGSAAYSLPTSSATVLGGVKVGTNLSISGTGVLSSANTTYTVGDGGLTQRNFTTTLKDKLDGVAAGATNTIGNATHTGEVTGSGALTISDNVVDEANLKVSNSPTNGYFLSAQSGNSGGLTWATVPAGYDDADVASYLASASSVGIGTSSPTGYDGEADNLVVASSGHTGITIASTGSNQRTNLYFSDGTVGSAAYVGGFSYDHNNDSLLVRTAAATRMTIDSSGVVEIPNSGAFRASSSNATKFVRMYAGGGTGKWDIYGNGANLRISDNMNAGVLAVDTGATFGGSVGIGTTYATDPNWGTGNKELAIDGTTGYGVIHLRGTGAGSTDTRYSIGVGDSIFYMAYDDVDGVHRAKINASHQLILNEGSGDVRAFHDGYHPNADVLTTARTINGVSFNGSANITVADSTKLPLTGGTASGDVTFSGGAGAITLNDSDIRSADSSPSWTGDPGTVGKIQYHANRWYIVSDSNSTNICTFRRNNGDQSYIDNSGNLVGGNADGWNNARTLSLTGDVTGSVSWNGSANASISASLSAPYSYIDTATGNYGTVKVDDDRGVTWAGYAIRDDWVFMANGADEAGIHNDTDNEWAVKCWRNAQVNLYYNGVQALQTIGNGIRVGNTTASDIYMADTDEGERRIHCNSNRIGFLNSSSGWSAYSEDGGLWYCASGLTVAGDATFTGGAAAISVAAGSDIRLGDGAWTGEQDGKIQHHSNGLYFQAQEFRFRNSGGTNVMVVNSSGNMTISGTVDGRDVAADGTKLDTIATSANNYSLPATPSVTSLNVADKIIHSGDIDTYTQFHAGDQWRVVTGGIERFEVNNTTVTSVEPIYAPSFHGDGSNLTGISSGLPLSGGTLTGDLSIPSKLIHAGDTDTYTRFNSDEFSVYTGGTERVKINNTYAYFNNYVTAPYFSATSDMNLKTDIKKIVNPLEMISNLNGYTFNWKESGEASAGVIAQEVEKVLPSAISENKEGNKSVNYNELIGVLIEAVKEQQVQIDSLKKMLGDN